MWPPAGRPPERRVELRDRARLGDVPVPYPLWTAVVAVLVFSAPNLLALALGAVTAPDDAATIEISPALLVVGLVFNLLFLALFFGLALLPLLTTRRLDRRLWGPQRTSWAVVGVGIGAGVAATVLAYGLNAVGVLVTGTEDPVEQQLVQDALQGGIALVAVVLLAVVVAPLTEEVIYRGVLFRALLGRMGPWTAALLSAALFAAIHLEVVFSQPVALVGLAAVGFVLAIGYHYVGNLWVPIIGHAVFNSISLALAVAVDRLGLDALAGVGAAARLLAPLTRALT